MARIYQADVWCDDCGQDIEARLRAEGKAPEDVCDEATFDSDDFPKYADEDEACDSPQHCGAGADCLAPTIIGGESYGHFLGNPLTPEGEAYVREAYERGWAVARFWARHYELTCMDGGVAELKSCTLLRDHPCRICGGKVNPYDCDATGAHEDCAE